MPRGASSFPARRRCRGSAVLELAIVIPVLVLLIGATVELGRFLYAYNTLAKAVRGATRHLAMADGSNAANAAWTTARQEACQLALFGTLAGGSTPLLPGLESSMVQIGTSGNLTGTAPYANSNAGCGLNCGIGWVQVTISGYSLAPVFSGVLPSSVLQGGRLPMGPITLTMRSWPFATATPAFGAASQSCAAI